MLCHSTEAIAKYPEHTSIHFDPLRFIDHISLTSR